MRRLIALLLEVVAVTGAWLQMSIGVRTDEAKYLLSIPYPHPPLLRGVMSLTDGWPLQEMVWRIVFATVLLQAVWIVWDLGRELPYAQRIALGAAWLFSAATVQLTGTVYLAVPTGVLGLTFFWLTRRSSVLPAPGAVALLWLCSLFSAFQAVLFVPWAWRALRQRSSSSIAALLFLCIPLLLLSLYVLVNPLVPASIIGLQQEAAAHDWGNKLLATLHVLLLAGSGVVTVLGAWGIVRSRDRALLLTGGLVVVYVLVTQGHAYYAILLLPVLIAGMVFLLLALPLPGAGVLPAVIGSGIVAIALWVHGTTGSRAHAVALLLQRDDIHPTRVMIDGPFGHEWQYELSTDVRRFHADLLPVTDVVLCTAACPALASWQDEWRLLPDSPVETWVRR